MSLCGDINLVGHTIKSYKAGLIKSMLKQVDIWESFVKKLCDLDILCVIFALDLLIFVVIGEDEECPVYHHLS